MKNTKSAPRRWATLPELADHLQISMATSRRLVANGTVPGYRMGKKIIRVDLNEVDAILGGQTIPNARSGQGVS